MYERPEKRARLTLLDDNGPRVDVYDGVSSALCLLFAVPFSDYKEQWGLRIMQYYLEFFLSTKSIVTRDY
jgi:hypothetical protein